MNLPSSKMMASHSLDICPWGSTVKEEDDEVPRNKYSPERKNQKHGSLICMNVCHVYLLR